MMIVAHNLFSRNSLCPIAYGRYSRCPLASDDVIRRPAAVKVKWPVVLTWSRSLGYPQPAGTFWWSVYVKAIFEGTSFFLWKCLPSFRRNAVRLRRALYSRTIHFASFSENGELMRFCGVDILRLCVKENWRCVFGGGDKPLSNLQQYAYKIHAQVIN